MILAGCEGFLVLAVNSWATLKTIPQGHSGVSSLDETLFNIRNNLRQVIRFTYQKGSSAWNYQRNQESSCLVCGFT